MLTTKGLIDYNLDTNIINIVKEFFWYNKDIMFSKVKYLERAKERCYIANVVVDVNFDYIEQSFNKRIEILKKDINNLFAKNTFNGNNYKSFKEFFEENELPFNSGLELQNFIISNF